ncbi:hypothetical protein PAPYR_6710 [Paratrimastix pyriformis]|uniref:RanBP2-type domain-containing protein n=1 Tax=Paratrimastix pyriformis TaxID=342808 RepID=A0ABQ8UH76_9EUKA|nr:hypothetical protein PAPYR_6710 [Paratrimastix pyriformis]
MRPHPFHTIPTPSIPLQWTCFKCTFAENKWDEPACDLCGEIHVHRLHPAAHALSPRPRLPAPPIGPPRHPPDPGRPQR